VNRGRGINGRRRLSNAEVIACSTPFGLGLADLQRLWLQGAEGRNYKQQPLHQPQLVWGSSDANSNRTSIILCSCCLVDAVPHSSVLTMTLRESRCDSACLDARYCSLSTSELVVKTTKAESECLEGGQGMLEVQVKSVLANAPKLQIQEFRIIGVN